MSFSQHNLVLINNSKKKYINGVSVECQFMSLQSLPHDVRLLICGEIPEMMYVDRYFNQLLQQYPRDSQDSTRILLLPKDDKTISDLIQTPARIQDPVVLNLSREHIVNEKFEYLHLPHLLSQYPQIQELKLSKMMDLPFSACLSSGLSRCRALQTLSLPNCDITGPMLELIAHALKQCNNLRHVDLSGNRVCHGSRGKFEGDATKGIEDFSSRASITTLNLSNNDLRERSSYLVGLLNRGGFAQLTTLALDENNWTDDEEKKIQSVSRDIQISLRKYPQEYYDSLKRFKSSTP